MNYKATINDRHFDITLLDNKTISVNGKEHHIDFAKVQAGVFSLLLDNQSYQLEIQKNNNGYVVRIAGIEYVVELEDEKAQLLKKLIQLPTIVDGHIEVKAPMPGLVVKVEVAPGDEIKVGSGLVILEAMKMENEIRSTVKGKVISVLVKEGEAVEKNAILIRIGGQDTI